MMVTIVTATVLINSYFGNVQYVSGQLTKTSSIWGGIMKPKSSSSSTSYATATAKSKSTTTSTTTTTKVPKQQQKQSTLQQLQPFLHYLFNTYTQPQYARFLKYPHALFFLQSLLIYDDDSPKTTTTTAGKDDNDVNETVSSQKHPSATTTNKNKLHIEWTLPAYRNFCHQQQFLAWQYRHSTCYGVGSHTNPLLPTDGGTTINDQQDTNASSES